MKRLHDLPAPSPEMQAHSESLRALIHAKIAQEGPISFAEYMQLALYAPGLGYYSAGLQKFGAEGDFITAPETTALFAQCLAREFIPVLQQLDPKNVLEFGAGSGRLALDLMLALDQLGQLPETYFILEVSSELRDRQRRLLHERLPQFKDRFQWIDRIPKQFCGIIIANEVLDAMPVHCFERTAQAVQELKVSLSNEQLFLQPFPASSALAKLISSLVDEYGYNWPTPYRSEINTHLRPWIQSVSDSLVRGVLYICDYGYSGAEYYHPQRSAGTLMCHYRHHAHDDPLVLVGLQDITSFVDFSAVARAMRAAELEIHGYTTQANFLLGAGLDEVLSAQHVDERQYLALAQQAKTLVLPGEMGERFKVIAAGRGIAPASKGFTFRDFTDRL